MRTPRWAGWLTSALLLLAAAVTAVSTWLHWQPCRGSMLNGSVVYGYRYPADFSDACLRRMDGGLPFPYPPEPAEQTAYAAELGVAAAVLLLLAWLTVVLTSSWGWPATLAAALPGLAIAAQVVVAVLALLAPDRDPDAEVPLVLWLSAEVLAVVALVLIWWWQPGARRSQVLSAVVVAWGATAFGLLHAVAEYVAMGILSDANWDLPPGSGYLTAGVIALSAVLNAVLTTRRPRVG